MPEDPGSEPRGESELLGNPLLDGLDAPESALEPLAQSFAQQQGSSSAPLLTNAVTAAHVDAAGGRAYAATRSSVPAQLLVHDLGTGSSQAHDLPVGNGAWDLSQSGSTLAIGLIAPWNTSTTWVQGFDTSTGRFTARAALPGANIVMSLAEDVFEHEAGNGRYFWAGTYHSGGAKLFLVDLQTGRAQQRASWSGSTSAYVRSLSVTPEGVTIGLGTQARVLRLDRACTPAQSAANTCPAPSAWSEFNRVIDGASFAYASAGATVEGGEGAAFTVTAVGTEQPAGLLVHRGDGDAERHALPDLDTVDRVAIDPATATAWFTARPTGALYRLDLLDPGSVPAVQATPVPGSETRELTVDAEGRVRGVAGTSELWKFDPASGGVESRRIIPAHLEQPDAVTQGVTRLPGKTLVNGHWRYQAHDDRTGAISTVELPGEPKTQVRVGDRLYVGLYPSAQIYRIDAQLRATRVTEIGQGQVRPAAIDYSEALGRLLVATGPAYGEYGGGLSLVDPAPGSTASVYPRPVGQHQVSAIAPHERGFFIGTAIQGEARPNLSGEDAQVRHWLAEGDASAGTTLWTRKIPGSAKVTGVELVQSPAGVFVLAGGVTLHGGKGWFAALEPGDGSLLWYREVAGPVTSFDGEDGYASALVGGSLVQLGASRTDIVLTPVKQAPAAGAPAYAALEALSGGAKQLAHVSTGAGAELGLAKQGVPRVAHRASGGDRYATAVAVSRETYARAETVILARGDDFADALAAGPLAAALDAPILLVQNGGLTQATKNEIARLGAKRAIPIGGTGAIPNSVRSHLPAGTNLDTGARLAGADRYATSLAVAKRLAQVKGDPRMEIMVATGTDFADAIAAGPAAIRSGSAIVLYDQVRAAAPVRDYLRGRTVHALGGPAANALRGAGIPAKSRLVGQDRFDTARLIAERYFSGKRPAYLAYGLDFPDGLAASVLAGRDGAPLLLSRQNALTAPTVRALGRGYGERYVMLVGGEGVMRPSLHELLRDAG